MTVVSADLDFAGATGKASRGGKREYTANYVVITDDKQDQAFTIIDYFLNTSGLPHPDKHTQYSYGNDSDSRAICDSLDPRRDPNSPHVWRVSVHFGDAQSPTEGQDENGDPTEDPTEFALKVSFRYNKVRRPVELAKYVTGFDPSIEPDVIARNDANGYQVPINSVAEPYDPPLERDAVTEILSITGNFGGIVDGEFTGQYMNVVNSERYTFFNINGFSYGADAYLSKIQNIAPVRKIAAGFSYWEITFDIETDREFGWRRKVVDRGLHRRALAGDPDGFGGVIAAADLADGVARKTPITTFGGHPVSVPELLDGKGQPFADPLAASPVYVTWAVYPEKKYSDIPLLGEVVQ